MSRIYTFRPLVYHMILVIQKLGVVADTHSVVQQGILWLDMDQTQYMTNEEDA